MLNLDNFYFFLLYLFFGIPGGTVVFIFFNFTTVFGIGRYRSFKKLWNKENIINLYMSPSSILAGIILFIIIIIIFV